MFLIEIGNIGRESMGFCFRFSFVVELSFIKTGGVFFVFREFIN